MKEALAALGVSESEFLQSLWNGLPVGCALVSLDGKFIRVNPTFSRWLQYPSARLETMTIRDITLADERQIDQEGFRMVAEGKAPYFVTATNYIARNGTPLAARATIYPLYTPDGSRILAVLSTIQHDDTCTPIQITDDLRVLWRFVGRYRKEFIVILLMIAFAGRTLVDAFFEAFRVVSQLFSGA